MKDNYGLIFPGISVIITQHMDRYRSGHNGPDSKCALALAVFSAENP